MDEIMKELEDFIQEQRSNYPDVPNFNPQELHFIERFAEYYHKKKTKNKCNECNKELESGTVFCCADCRIHYYRL